ncbi:MAG: hypothetical protein AAFQ43_06760 [Bacteroidota bacterium]
MTGRRSPSPSATASPVLPLAPEATATLRICPLLLLLAAGCTPQADRPSAQAFVDACLASTNWERPMCTCAEERARDQLSDATYAFIAAASMGDDDAETARLRDGLSFADATQGGLPHGRRRHRLRNHVTVTE